MSTKISSKNIRAIIVPKLSAQEHGGKGGGEIIRARGSESLF